ncbi:MAG: FecR domain-containing protein [Planctomycetota bacterium]|nr:FecR domain-containing protein [Planctomycetota bacterium]
MNLTDQEILELTELCNSLVDGRSTDVQQTRLAEQLAASEAARQFYVRFLGLSASLHQYAAEMQTDAVDVAVSVPRPWWRRKFAWAFGSLALAAALLIALTLGTVGRSRSDALADVEAEESVAQVTGVKDCRPTGALPAWRPGEQIRCGQRLDLASGLLEITFDCGAQVTLEGPATFDANSAWEAALTQGTLHASVPPEAIGFRIASPAVEVLDLGTEFTVVAAAGGNTEVFVVQGQVEATPRDSAGHTQPVVMLHAEQAHRFGPTGNAEIAGAKAKVTRFAKRAKLERFAQPVGYVQWSFDEPEGRLLRAVSARLSSASYDAHLESVSTEALSEVRVPGRWQGALRLDGTVYAEAPAPESAASTAWTVACWVRIAPDAAPAEASAMVAWRMKAARKADGWPVEIGWNPRPAHGTFGALRTQCGRDCLVGTTPLRDGRWHHVAAVLVPHARGSSRLHVKLYVDGQLERVTVTRTAAHARKHHRETIAASSRDRIFLGRRLDTPPAKGFGFRGELDELLIADRALTPQEIKRLIHENRPESPSIVAAAAPDAFSPSVVAPEPSLETPTTGRTN